MDIYLYTDDEKGDPRVSSKFSDADLGKLTRVVPYSENELTIHISSDEESVTLDLDKNLIRISQQYFNELGRIPGAQQACIARYAYQLAYDMEMRELVEKHAEYEGKERVNNETLSTGIGICMLGAAIHSLLIGGLGAVMAATAKYSLNESRKMQERIREILTESDQYALNVTSDRNACIESLKLEQEFFAADSFTSKRLAILEGKDVTSNLPNPIGTPQERPEPLSQRVAGVRPL